MDVDNPYAPPEADLRLTPAPDRYTELAPRLTRLAAAFVDGLISLMIGVPLMFALGIWTYIAQGQNPPPGLLIASGAIGFAVFLLMHGYFLKTNGQTLGKKLVGIRIADLDGNVPDFAKVVLLRYLPLSFVANIPVVGAYLPLVDVLFIFGRERRCLHDLLAGTKVVAARRRG